MAQQRRASAQVIVLRITCHGSRHKRLFTNTVTLTIEKNKTWFQLLTERLELEIPQNRNVFVTSSNGHWIFPLEDRISTSLNNYKRKLRKYTVLVRNEPNWEAAQSLEQNNENCGGFGQKINGPLKTDSFSLYEDPSMTSRHETEHQLQFEGIYYDRNARANGQRALNEDISDQLFLRANREFVDEIRGNPQSLRYFRSRASSLYNFLDAIFTAENQ